jgi:hypothetical protein
MNIQLSSASNSLLLTQIFDFLEYFSCRTAGPEFESLWKRGSDMESAEIPNDRYHQFGELHHVNEM